MASLKDTVVSGSLRATDTIYSTTNQFQILKIPTSSNGTTYGMGDNGQILKSNGTSVYWANDNDTTNLTSMTGTLDIGHGGTGSATADGARTNLGLGSLAIKSALIESDIPTLSIIDKTSGTLTVARGGTGATSFTANSVVISGNTSTAALTTTGTGMAGQYLISNGENNPPSWEELKIGGRNLLLDSARERTVTVAAGKTDASFNEISLSEYGATQITEGAELTASFDYEVDLTKTTNGAFYTRLNTTSTVPARVVSDIIAVPRGRASIMFNVTAAQAQYSSDFVFRVRIALSNEGASLKIWNVKLELGDHATDWTPAPEDFIETTNGIYYGVCNTEQATQAKEATLVNGSNFSLKEGTMVAIKFTYASAASTMTLDVNGTGAKNLYLYGTSVMSSTTSTNGWPAGAIVMFIYDGTSWIRQYWYNTTYTLTSVLSNTAAATAAKVGSNSSYFTIKDGTYFDFTLRYSNTVQSALTLNINSTGAKPIYINGEPSSNTNYELPGGKYLVYYNDNKYYFINPGQQNAPDSIIGPVTGNGAITGPQALNKLGIIYSSSAPPNPIEGMIWLQPI